MFRAARRHAGHPPDSPDGGDLRHWTFAAPGNSADALDKEAPGGRTQGHERRGPVPQPAEDPRELTWTLDGATRAWRPDGGYGFGAGLGPALEAGRPARGAGQREARQGTDRQCGIPAPPIRKDAASPSRSNCEGDCAKAWPPAPPAMPRPRRVPMPSRPVRSPAPTAAVNSPGAEGRCTSTPSTHRDRRRLGGVVGGTRYAAAPDGRKATVNTEGSSGAEPAGPAGLSVRRDPELGDAVVGRRGMTVYRFRKDVARPVKSACTRVSLSNPSTAGPSGPSPAASRPVTPTAALSGAHGSRCPPTVSWPVRQSSSIANFLVSSRHANVTRSDEAVAVATDVTNNGPLISVSARSPGGRSVASGQH